MAENYGQFRVASQPGGCDGGDVKILVAPDSFGTTLSAGEAAEVIASTWRRSAPHDEVRTLPLSDGGPGFLDVLAGENGIFEPLVVQDAKGQARPIRVLLREGSAYVESAEIIGRGSYPESSDLVRSGSSYGVGEALLFGFSRARRVVIGLGGTAINDGGAGLLAALGASANVRLDQGGIGLAGIKELNMARACEAVAGCEILIATDVDNPLTGPQGASEMYAPQKGATPADVRELEAHLLDYQSALVTASSTESVGAGSGAAGGLGAALLALGGRRVSGIEEVARQVELASAVEWADLVVTGEGSFDWQSLRGKVVSGVAFHATRLGKPTIVLAGQVHCGRREYTSIGIESAYAMAETQAEIAESIAQPRISLAALVERVSRTWSR